MPAFTISHLDHVAIHATNTAASVDWYERVLGLQKMQLKEWGEFPIFMLAGKVGVAIFKANPNLYARNAITPAKRLPLPPPIHTQQPRYSS